MKRYVRTASVLNSVTPEHLRKCAAEMRKRSYPTEDTVSQTLYYKRIDGLCRWIMMLCDEAIESGSDIDFNKIQDRLEGTLDTDRYLHNADEIRADKALLEWFKDICS